MNRFSEQQLSILDLPHVVQPQPEPSKESDSFDTPKEQNYRSDGPETSEKAGRSVNNAFLEQKVYETIKSFGEEGAISDEICAVLSHIKMSAVTPRFKKLTDKGFIEKIGTRKADSGRSQTIWRAKK